MGPLARAAELSGEKITPCKEGEEEGGRAWGRGEKGPVSHCQGHCLAPRFMQPGDYFKPRQYFAFKPWKEHKPFKVPMYRQVMGAANIDSWS